jgi:hypothetical protein
MNWDCWQFRYFWKGLFRYHVFGRHTLGSVCLACVKEKDVPMVTALARAAHEPAYLPPACPVDSRWPEEPCGARTWRDCHHDPRAHQSFDAHMTFLHALALRQAAVLGAKGEAHGETVV